MQPDNLLLIDIDGLRPDAFYEAFNAGRLPNIQAMLGGSERMLSIPVVSTAPSITFCAQASLFTGKFPKEHGVPGNQFFDRFAKNSQGEARPRHFGFDVGDLLAVDDAVQVFTHGLASSRLRVPTIYERLAQNGWHFTVAGNMYAAGAQQWIKPNLLTLARVTKGSGLLGIDPPQFDQHIFDKLYSDLQRNRLPPRHGITLYLMGLDVESHKKGPQSQANYLAEHVDPLLGKLWQTIQDLTHGRSLLVTLFSDHGQIAVPAEDTHSIRLGFPFDLELTPFFQALGLDLHDVPGEDPNVDADVALNGGLAHVYLHNQEDRWAAKPLFARDVLPVGRAFWEANESGRYSEDLRNALSGVLIRNVEQEGWDAQYRALTPSGRLIALHEWFSAQEVELYVDPVNRIDNLTSRYSGDLLLISNYADGYYFGKETSGVHGGLHPDDSHSLLVYGSPTASVEEWRSTETAIQLPLLGAVSESRHGIRQLSIW